MICPQHLEGHVTFTCARCGAFGCDVCRGERAEPLCSACAARAAASALPVVEILRDSVLFLLRRPVLLLLVASANAFQGALTLRLTDSWADILWASFFGALVAPFLQRYVADQVLAPERPVRDSLEDGLRRLPASFGASLLVSGAVLLGGLAFVLPGLFLLVVLSLAGPAVVLQGAHAFDALSISWQLTRRYRWRMGLLTLLTYAPVFGIYLVFWEFQAWMAERDLADTLLAGMLEEGVSGVSTCLESSVLVFSYLRLSGRWMETCQDRC